MNNIERYPVSIVISALNEEMRIKETIESARNNNPAEIIVVEGGSTDQTAIVAKEYADKVYSVEQYGLGYKRAYGVEKASEKYILNLDADQVLENNALRTMIKELEENNFVGIQAQLKSIRNETYWERAMGYNVGITHSKPRESNMIGTPALYRADILKMNNFDKSITGSCDDTDLCYRLSNLNYKLGISSVICYQKHRSTFRSTVKKFTWYGEGDFVFSQKHPERFWSIFIHPIKNYFFIRSFKAIKDKKFQYIPFFMLIGTVRHIGFYKAFFKSIFGEKRDSRIINRNDAEF